jgi:hypothetical protein
VTRAKERTSKADEALVKAQEALEEASEDRARIKVQLTAASSDLSQALQRCVLPVICVKICAPMMCVRRESALEEDMAELQSERDALQQELHKCSEQLSACQEKLKRVCFGVVRS